MNVQNPEGEAMPAGAVKDYISEMVEELAKLAQTFGDLSLAQRLREVHEGAAKAQEPS